MLNSILQDQIYFIVKKKSSDIIKLGYVEYQHLFVIIVNYKNERVIIKILDELT